MRIMVRPMAAAAVISLLAAGCSGQGTAPFGGTRPGPAGNAISGPVVIGKVYDIEGVLHNYSQDPVRLTSLRLISPTGPGFRVLSMRAYLLSQTGGVGDIDEGDLPKTCPELYKPHPVTDVSVPPRSSAKWVIAIALVFRKPGRYHFGELRIGYLKAGHAGWQDFYIRPVNMTTVSQRMAPRLYHPTYCTKYVAPSVAVYFVRNVSQGGLASGELYSNGNVSKGATILFRTPNGKRYKEKVTASTWRRSGNTVAFCLHLVGASPGAPAADRICARDVPVTDTWVRTTDAYGRTMLVRVGRIPGSWSKHPVGG